MTKILVWDFRTRLFQWVVAALAIVAAAEARAVTNIFFNASQTATVISSNINAVALRSGDYLFTYTADGYWSSYAGGPPTGRFFSVFWPNGIQAQAITAGPSVGVGANITIKRADGKLFDLRAFTGKLLANTAATGGAFEIMPQLNGEDAFNNPLMFDCSGYGGQSFPHTPLLAGYDTYKIHLWVDWALTALTLIDTNASTTATITASVSPAGAGLVTGAGSFPLNTVGTLTATAHPGWSFQKWTENGAQISTATDFNFTLTTNRSLVAVFVPLPPLLEVVLDAPGALKLTWPTNQPGYTLQENADAGTTNWVTSGATVIVAGTNNQAIVPTSGSQKFFRLKSP